MHDSAHQAKVLFSLLASAQEGGGGGSIAVSVSVFTPPRLLLPRGGGGSQGAILSAGASSASCTSRGASTKAVSCAIQIRRRRAVWQQRPFPLTFSLVCPEPVLAK
jgi:hypothetical protein